MGGDNGVPKGVGDREGYEVGALGVLGLPVCAGLSLGLPVCAGLSLSAPRFIIARNVDKPTIKQIDMKRATDIIFRRCHT